jgi:hypothetical protein
MKEGSKYMNESEWKTFLTEYNEELLSYEQIVEALPRELIKAVWLGYNGVAEAEIVATEKRLDTRLPPSYRTFLKVSNGWRFPSVSIFDLLPATKVVWFREQNQDWIDAYVVPSAELPPITDKEYFVYGAKQDCVKFRTEYLPTALQISDVGDSAVVLLNPKVITPEGEWETWFFANWLPGAVRYRSFAEWLTAERKTCRKQFKSLHKAKVKQYVTAKKPVSVKKAQAAARNGQIELALESLEAFASKGDDAAASSLAELYAFLGQWDKVISNAGRLIANPGAVYAGNVFHDMVQLLGRAGHRSREWSLIIEAVEAARKTNANRFAELRQEAKDRIHRDIYEQTENRNEKIFRNLIEYAERQGTPPHELLAIFGVSAGNDLRSEEEKRTWYEEIVKNADTIRPDLKKNPQVKVEYFFSLAKGTLEDEALRLYEAHGKNFVMAWQAAEYVAPVYIRRGNAVAAWAAIEANLKNWWPVDQAQVAPLVLLTNEYLETLMTPERCQLVLSTPRGPEGTKAGK